MIEILNKEECCGCWACVNVCPKKCITMEFDNEGFAYPKIDMDVCINCGLCEKVCPTYSDPKGEEFESKAFACKNKNEQVRMSSSSGGVFTLLCEKVIESNGVVFGAALDKDMVVKHCSAQTIEECEKFKGSKYVQSQIENTYSEAKKYLDEGRLVLFSGTQCQIKGLNLYLRKPYSNLISVDVICHGVPSPMVLETHKNNIKKKYKSEIKNIKFRDKRVGWHKFSFVIEFENNKEYARKASGDPYLRGFLSNLFLRPSCYECKSKNFTGKSDISLADFWGIENINAEFADEKGISLILVNSEKGLALFNRILDNIDYIEADLKDAIKRNKCIIQPTFKTEFRKDFFKVFEEKGLNRSVVKFVGPSPETKVRFHLYWKTKRVKKLIGIDK